MIVRTLDFFYLCDHVCFCHPEEGKKMITLNLGLCVITLRVESLSLAYFLYVIGSHVYVLGVALFKVAYN